MRASPDLTIARWSCRVPLSVHQQALIAEFVESEAHETKPFNESRSLWPGAQQLDRGEDPQLRREGIRRSWI
jgi:hypothetical protein